MLTANSAQDKFSEDNNISYNNSQQSSWLGSFTANPDDTTDFPGFFENPDKTTGFSENSSKDVIEEVRINHHPSIPKTAFHIESEIPGEFRLTRARQLHSLAPGSWITSTVLEDFIQHLINCYERESSILLLSSAIYQSFLISNRKFPRSCNIVQFLHHHQALSKDLLLVIINTDPRGKGSHWL